MVRSLEQLDEPVIEPLTVREKEVLVLLAQSDLDYRDIASRLYLAPNSVKWYTRQIYAKLGVNNRRQAVNQAKTYGLLEEPTTEKKHNLPALLTPFVGHQVDLDYLRQSLSDPTIRLITLTGTGGVGKTRLAVQTAGFCQEMYPSGVWMVELASLRDSSLIAERIIASLNLDGTKSQDSQTFVRNFLKNKKILLVLDNCEHVIDACARLVDFLLSACPNLQILTTSREKLGLTGEVVYKVPSLECPNPTIDKSSRQIESYEAVRFFIQRAKEIQPGFIVTPEGIRAIAAICQKLDGIPLALELAAARLTTLDIDQISNYLEESFEILSGGSRVSLPRHQTMRASIEWSYRLLSDADQKTFKCLSVFAGGWTLEALSEVCAQESGEARSELQLLTQLELLVEKSLVVAHLKGTRPANAEEKPSMQTRYTMLEPIRQYAYEKLEKDGEKTEVVKRHAAYFLRLALRAEPNLRGADQMAWLVRLEAELDNLRLALSELLPHDVSAELQLASALMWFWHNRRRWEEGLDWITKGLQQIKSIEKSLNGNCNYSETKTNMYILAKALAVAGYLHGKTPANQEDAHENEKAAELYKESLAIYKKQIPQDSKGMALVLLRLSRYSNESVSHSQILSWVNQSLALYREEEDDFGLSECLSWLGMVERNIHRAEGAFSEALRLKRKIGDIHGIASQLEALGALAFFKCEYDLAYRYRQEGLENFRKIDNNFHITRSLGSLAWSDWLLGRNAQALDNIEEAMALSIEQEPQIFALLRLIRARIHISTGRFQESNQDIRIALQLGEDIPSRLAKTSALILQARMASIEGDTRSSINILDKAMALCRDINMPTITSEVLYTLGRITALHGSLSAARSLFVESTKKYQNLLRWREKYLIAYPFEGLAGLAVVMGDHVRAAKLFGAANRRLSQLAITLASLEYQIREKEIEQARQNLGDEVYSQYWQEGWNLSFDQAVAYALNQQ